MVKNSLPEPEGIPKLPSVRIPELSIVGILSKVCLKCNISFKTKKDLELHLFNERKPYKCLLCQASFKSLIGLSQHTGKKHTRHRPYRCLLCLKRFKSIYAVRNHRKQVHMHSTMQICQLCGKQLFNKFSLSRHTKVCTDTEKI
jgi:DNA-directed RNA polymerase subunit RPC12/RpoP